MAVKAIYGMTAVAKAIKGNANTNLLMILNVTGNYPTDS